MTTQIRLSLAAALALAMGCGVEPDLGPDAPEPEFLVNAKDQVEGSYGQAGTAVQFHFQRVRDQKVIAAIKTRDGFTLVETIAGNGFETTTILGGQYAASGTREEIADKLGRDALAELAAMPEMQLVPELRKQLTDAGVSPELLAGLSSVTKDVVYCPTVPVDMRRPLTVEADSRR